MKIFPALCRYGPTMICRLAIACLILLTARPTLSGEGVTHWALRPVEKPSLPEVDNKAWVKNPIDLFVLARLEEADLEPSPRLPPVVASKGAPAMEPPMSTAFMPSVAKYTSTTFTQRCSTCWASITKNSPTATEAATSD